MKNIRLFKNIENIVGIPLPKLYRDINLIVNKNESTYEDINNIIINHQDNIKKFLVNKNLFCFQKKRRSIRISFYE